jgi:hypothetical protein
MAEYVKRTHEYEHTAVSSIVILTLGGMDY